MYQIIVLSLGFLFLFSIGYYIKHTDTNGVLVKSLQVSEVVDENKSVDTNSNLEEESKRYAQ